MAIQRRLVEAVEVTENRVHVIRLKDIFDASTVNEFEKVVSYLLARNFYKVVVDLGHVEFISSAGWSAFTAELRRVRENRGDVKLANMSPDICDVFLLLELDSFIQSFDTVDEALAAFSQPVVAPEPEPARPSILQEIKAASRSREMAEAGARVAAERHASDFVERSREHTVAGQETYAAACAAPVSKKAAPAGTPRDSERVYVRAERTIDNVAPLIEAEGAVGTPHDKDGAGEQFEYAVERSVPRGERKATAPSQGESFDGQSENVLGSGAAEAEYGESSHSPYGRYTAAEQAEYAGDDYAGEAERESFSLEAHDEGGTTRRVEYAGDDYADEGEYENSSVGSDNGSEQAEYAGDDYAGEGEDESYTAESDDESGAAGQAEYAGDEYAGGDKYENYLAESDDEYGTVEQVDHGVEAQNDYAMAGDDGENGSGHLTPPAPAASGPEMWELILASSRAPVDPYMFEKSVRMFPEEEKPPEFLASGATKPFSGGPNEEDSLPGSGSEISAPDTSADADNAFDEFAGLGVEPDLDFAGHEPFVDDNSRTGTDSASAAAEAGFEHAPVKSSPDGGDDEEFDEFETQDIRDPWILDEIDTLPEEDEMEGGGADEEESSFSAAELLSYDLELEAPLSQFPDQAPECSAIEAAGELPTRFGALSQAGIEDSFDKLSDLSTPGAEEEAQVEPGFARQAEAHAMLPHDGLQGDFSAPSMTDENLAMPGDESFDPPAKPGRKRAARTKKSKSKTKRGKPGRAIEAEAPISPQAEPAALFHVDTADADDGWRTHEENEEAQRETTFAPTAEVPAFLQENDPAEDFHAPPAPNENGDLIARASELPSLPSHHGNDEASHDYPPDGALPKIPASDNLEEIIRAVVATHPDFGPAMICKFIEDRFEPPVLISRSAVYRFLREADLNTREKRQAYADQLFDPSMFTEEI